MNVYRQGIEATKTKDKFSMKILKPLAIAAVSIAMLTPAKAADTHTCRGVLTVNWTEGVANGSPDNGGRLIRADEINRSCLFDQNSAAGRKILAVCQMGFPCEVKARV